MGDIAEMVLDGTLCEGCGAYIGEAVGFPRKCECCDEKGIVNHRVRAQFKDEIISNTQFDLHKAGFAWETKNGGIHMKVKKDNKVVADLWPTTGKYAIRSKGPKAINGTVQQLIKELNK